MGTALRAAAPSSQLRRSGLRDALGQLGSHDQRQVACKLSRRYAERLPAANVAALTMDCSPLAVSACTRAL
jgi:hypothetical protein